MRNDTASHAIGRRGARTPLWISMRRDRKTAQQIIRHFGIDRPPINIWGLVQAMGIVIGALPPNDSTSGMLSIDNDMAEIYYAPKEHPARQRFTIAHELGHLMLHEIKEAHRDITFNGSPLEIQANRFAADILMPLEMVDAHVLAYGQDVKLLADIFVVSAQAMEIRLRRLAGLR